MNNNDALTKFEITRAEVLAEIEALRPAISKDITWQLTKQNGGLGTLSKNGAVMRACYDGFFAGIRFALSIIEPINLDGGPNGKKGDALA